MLVKRSISVPLAAAAAFSSISSLDTVFGCLPAVTITRSDGNSCQGELSVAVGPATVRLSGTAVLVDLDPQRRRLLVRAHGKDQRRQCSVDADITVDAAEQSDSASRLDIWCDIRIRGPAAHRGGGVVDEVVDVLLDQLAATMNSPAPRRATPTGTAADTQQPSDPAASAWAPDRGDHEPPARPPAGPDDTPGPEGLGPTAIRRELNRPTLAGFVIGALCGALIGATLARSRCRACRLRDLRRSCR